jgi:uncharacterized membrane protein HdeD (DUF308 family)
MNRFRNPLKVNGILLLVVFLFALAASGARFADLPFVLGTMMLLLAPVNLIIGMVRNRNKKPDGSAFILFAGILLLVGFSTCSAGFYFNDVNFH